MRIRKRPDAKTRCLYPEDIVDSIGSSPKSPSEQEEGQVSSKPAAASDAAEEKDPELERRKYKHLGWPSSVTFSFIQTKTPTQDSSTNPDNNEEGNEDEVQSKSEENKKRLSKTMVIGGGSGYVEDEKYEQFYDCKMRNSYTGFPSTKETLSSDSSRQGDVTGTFLLNYEYGEESGDSEENCKTRSLNSIYRSTQNLNPAYNTEEENEMPIIGQSKKMKRMQRGETNQG